MKHSYYYDNWKKADLPVIEITDERVNPFIKHGLRMVAIAGNTLPLGTFKFLAALAMWEGLQQAGLERKKQIESSSGEFAKDYVFLANDFGARVEDITIVMKTDVPRTKAMMPSFLGAQTIELSGAQTPIQYAREHGGGGWIEGRGWDVTSPVINPDQYAWPGISLYYRDWAVPKMLDGTGGIDYLISPVGTGGTIIGFKEGLAKYSDRPVEVIAAVCADGQEIPGMRTVKSASPPEVLQPWKNAADHIIGVQRRTAFLSAPWVSRATSVLAGPSGGGTYAAGCMFAHGFEERGEEELLNGKTLAFIVHDTAAAYVGDRYPEFDLEDLRADTAPLPEELIFGKKAA